MKKILIILVLTIMSSIVMANAPAIHPGIQEIKIERGRGQGSFMIFNQGEEVKRYKVTVRDIDNAGNESALSKNLKAFPRFVEVEPGSNKTVRLLIRDFPETEDGEYRASISIEEIVSELTETHKTQTVADGITTNIEYNYIINSAIYGYVGKLHKDIKVEIEEKEGVMVGKVINNGNYSYPLTGKFLGEDGKIIQEGAVGKLMDEGELKVNFEIPEGSNTFEILDDKNEVLYKRDIQQ